MKNLFISLIMITSLLTCNSACATEPTFDNSVIPTFDLSRYLGQWYEIARFDHRFERDMTNAAAYYSLNDNGTVRVENSGWRGAKYKISVGKAKQPNPDTQPALLRVSFFGPFYSDYRILMLSSDYRYSLVGSGSSKYLWILSRTPELPHQDRMNILREAQRRGYDVTRLIWVDQSENIRSLEEPMQMTESE